MKRPVAPLQGSHHTGQRRGISLIELMIVISLMAVVAGSSCVLIARMMQSNRTQSATLIQRRTMHLWQLQFQQDGREAQSARLDDTPPAPLKIEFLRPEGQVVAYQMVDHGLERHVDGKLSARWACGPGSWSFSLRENSRIARAEFHPSTPQPDHDSASPGSDLADAPSRVTPMPLQIDVALTTNLYRLPSVGVPQ